MNNLSAYEESAVEAVMHAYGVTRGCAIANLFPRKATEQDQRELDDQKAKWRAERKVERA